MTSSRALKVKKRRLVLGPAAWRERASEVEESGIGMRVAVKTRPGMQEKGRGRKIIKRQDITRLKCRWPNAKEMGVKCVGHCLRKVMRLKEEGNQIKPVGIKR